ncbi:hypothetical protein FJZ40_04745 [Candidatus Shapirobacteria bacterium]|nr:hypothetical protein [Candidatus Shapirobacteria bacterium]
MENLDLGQALEKFVTDLTGRSKSSNTILAYRGDLEQVLVIFKKDGINHPVAVDSVQIEKIKAEFTHLGYTPKSISRKLNSIRAFFRFLKKEGVIENDPSGEIVYPKLTAATPRILTKLEYRALRDACRNDPRLAAIVEIFLQTGVRISELANLRLSDVKDDSLFIRAQESNPARTIPLNRVGREALERYLKKRPKSKTDYVFVTANGRQFLIRNIRQAIKRHLEIAGIKNASVNDLRHTFIAHHLEAGTPLATLSKIAGHKRISTTEKYLAFVKPKEKPTKLEEL